MSQPLNPLTLPLSGSWLIEASAGTGKTYTLAALYVRPRPARKAAWCRSG